MSNITPIQQAIATLETPAFKQQLTALLPTHVKVDQFLSVARRGIHGNKALNFTNMDKNTLFSSVLKAAEQGMKLDGEEAALVQYGSNVQFMKMIKGVKKQLRNSGEIKEITAEVVYQNDKFEYWVDDEGKHIKHTPNFLADRGEPMAAYSVITTKDGGRYIKVMSKQEIEAVKSASKTGNASFSPWNGAFKTEMWCKTVLRRNAKDAPTSTDLPEVFKDWDEDFDFQNPTQAQDSRMTNASAGGTTESSSSVSVPAKPIKRKKTVIDGIIESESETQTTVEAQDPSVVDVESLPI
jgi:recombination protein RecT